MIDWSRAPEWANWAAMDSDGDRTWFETRPEPGVREWETDHNFMVYEPGHSTKSCPNWRERLYRRPDTKPQSSEPEQGGTVSDMVNHPPHYKQGEVECIKAIEAALTPEAFRGYCKGNALKYIWREEHKGGSQDLAKAIWYLSRLERKG